MQPIEGITPEMLWTFFVVLVGLGALIILGDKVIDVWRRHKERKEAKDGPDSNFAEKMCKKIYDKIDPRLREIEEKLTMDKAKIDTHTQQLSALEANYKSAEQSRKIICRGVKALLSHEINGNSVDKLNAALTEIDDYLINK